MMVLFAFEVDVLEILLRDSLDLLDKLFIVEAEVTHKGVRSHPTTPVPEAQAGGVEGGEGAGEVPLRQHHQGGGGGGGGEHGGGGRAAS